MRLRLKVFVLGTPLCACLIFGKLWGGFPLPSLFAQTPADHEHDAEVINQVKTFLEDYWAGFERDDVNHMAAAHTRDYAAYFSIPAHGAELQLSDAEGIVKGLTGAFAQFRGHHPRMELANIIVLPRLEGGAAASYRQLFYLDGQFKGEALAISELRKEGGRWKVYRHFEVKRH